jgi:hypothetical protein
MRPARLDIDMYAGDDYSLALTFTDADGVAIDLSGRAYRAQIRETVYDADVALADLAVDATRLAAGVVTLALARATTAGLPRSCVWDLEETGVDNKVRTLLAGTVALRRDVTR